MRWNPSKKSPSLPLLPPQPPRARAPPPPPPPPPLHHHQHQLPQAPHQERHSIRAPHSSFSSSSENLLSQHACAAQQFYQALWWTLASFLWVSLRFCFASRCIERELSGEEVVDWLVKDKIIGVWLFLERKNRCLRQQIISVTNAVLESDVTDNTPKKE